MEVIALHREMYEAKAKALTACSQRKADLVKESSAAQRGDACGDPQRDMHGMVARQ